MSHSRSTRQFFSPDDGDQFGVGIAENPLQPTVGPESWKGKQYGERLGVFHRSSWTTATRSLPQISDKIRGLVALDQTQSGCGVERPHACSLIHFNVRRATKIKSIGGTVEYLYRGDTYLEAIVRGVRGWVIKGNNQWEKVQISFALMGKDNSTMRIFVDGMLASGLGGRVPVDSRFTYSMEPEYSSNITTFAQAMLDDIVNYKGVDR